MARVLVIVSYQIFPADMGGQKGIVKFYHYLEGYHDVFMAVSTDNGWGHLPANATRPLFANKWMPLNLFRLKLLANKIREHQIDVIIAEHSYTGWIAFLLKMLTQKAFIIHSHNIETARFRQMKKGLWQLYAPFEKWIHRKADFNFFKTAEDLQFAMKAYGLPAGKCAVLPYGVDPFRKVNDAESIIKKRYGIKSDYLFYFNGTLDYFPNAVGVENLLAEINPLLERSGLSYHILISGKRLPLPLQEKIASSATMSYLGFVDEVEPLYQGCNLFLNPVINNAGVKTKVVEALANHCAVVSTRSGAAGVPPACCGSQVTLVNDGDWPAFAAAVVSAAGKEPTATRPAFFDHFLWTNIARTAAQNIEAIAHAGK